MPDRFITRQAAEQDILMTAAFIAERVRSAEGHGEAVEKVVPQILAAGNVDLAAEMSNAVDDPFVRDRLLTRVAARCAELGDDEYALQLIDAIDDVGMRSVAFERCALAKLATGDLDAAVDLADSIPHPDNVLSTIAVEHYKADRREQALSILDEIDFAAAEVATLVKFAAIDIDSENHASAADQLASAADAADGIEQNEERLAALVEIATGYIAAKRNDLAISTFADARDLAATISIGHRDFFLSNCAIGFHAAGSSDLAEETVEMITDKVQIGSTLLGFARESWRKDDKETAIDDLTEGFELVRDQSEREIRDSKTRNALMASFAVQFAGFGKTDDAIAAAEANDSDEQRVAAFSQIAQILDLQGESDLADDVIAKIDSPADRAAALAARSGSINDRGDAAAARGLIERAGTEASAIEQVPALAATHRLLAERAAIIGSTDLAAQNVTAAIAAAAEILDTSMRASLIGEIASVVREHEITLTDSDRSTLFEMIVRADS